MISNLELYITNFHRPIQRGFGTGQPVWDRKFLSQSNGKTKNVIVYSTSFPLLKW